MARIVVLLLFLAPGVAWAQAASLDPGSGGGAGRPGGADTAGDPAMPTCPVANCPTRPGVAGGGGGPTLSSVWVHGHTTGDSGVSEFQTNLGLYIGTGATTGAGPGGNKVTLYAGAMQGPGAGPGWTLNTDIVRGGCPGGANSLYGMPGSGTPFGTGCGAKPGSLSIHDATVGYEMDLTNWDQDGGAGGPLVIGVMLNTASSYTSTAGIYYAVHSGQTVPSWHNGLQLTGPADGAPRSVKDNTIDDASGSDYGIHMRGEHAQSTFRDDSTGTYGLTMLGRKAGGDLFSASASPVSINIQGSHATASIADSANAPVALTLSGKYATSAISTEGATTPAALIAKPGQSVCWGGAGIGCITWDQAHSKWVFTSGGRAVASISADGNAVFRGTVTQGGVP